MRVENYVNQSLAAGRAETIESVARAAGVTYQAAQRTLRQLWLDGVLSRHTNRRRHYYEGRQLSLPLH